MQTATQHSTDHHKALGEIVRRTSMPFLVFAIVLAGLLLLSWFLLLPGLTHVQVAGSEKSIAELVAYKKNLSDKITGLEKQRDAALLPSQDAMYRKIIAIKEDRLRFQQIRQEVTRTARTFLSGFPDVIAFHSLTYNAAGGTVKLTGRVHDVGLQSMTVEAQFVDALKHISFVRDVRSSRYAREKDENGKYISPFTIQLSIKPR